jgi:hypothetical protein
MSDSSGLTNIDDFILGELVTRIRTECPVFENRCGPAADFDLEKMANTSIQRPHCTVVPISGVGFSKETGVTQQNLRHTYATIITVDNKPRRLDGKDLTPYGVLETCRQQLTESLLNWKPATQAHQIDEIILQSSNLIQETEGLIMYQFLWNTDTNLWAVSSISPDCSVADTPLVDEIYLAFAPNGEGTVPKEDYILILDRFPETPEIPD